ncbi:MULTISPECIES: DUF2500 domain-containing protein [Paenibacillus]|jgi:hypothetical protein|uniref:DUF2500 domain-containing protein n=2 Tax=Paenibacillus lactis TaxID=228574 RepID=G4HFX1_9BACL|nr:MULTISPECIES: DUF2500 domain-containing protein [Paenibacillus]EHB64638.1 Protein of unknown function DUF2500 [Paenibacillus lactis 154]MBP1892663.1 hypothetical protein [Paenibacillus lactis]MCM3494979.1 DUF2500 domain-containing protein [Paenibacillus lactis]GIO91606.1 hypothetical protein J31TS3_28330 [Paenibacillus lactis]HAF97352.1 DUF2500 domain-containing protein [Paenibacillus lactis]
MGSGSEWMFDFFGSVMPIFFIVVIGIIILSAGKGILQWSQNNRQPLLTVDSKIVSKRTEVKHTHHTDEAMSSRTRTTYYLTFEVESGDRMEFVVNGEEFGMCAEGDEGLLRFQGTRYYSFVRHPKSNRDTVRGYGHHKT